MKTSDFEYELPERLIAQTPVEPRDASRLMVVHRDSGEIEDRLFRDVVEYLRPGDLLVLNQTRVIPARLFGHKVVTGGKVELLLLHRRDDLTWEALVGGKGLRPGVVVEIAAIRAADDADRQQAETAPALPVAGQEVRRATIVGETAAGGRLVRFEEPVEGWLDEVGVVPLPPYIHEPLADEERYQTVYGRIEGSVAASTAGLHFTPELLVQVRRMGVELAFVTLHIGLDTFRPVKEETVEEHPMHTEWIEVTAAVAEQVNRARLEGRRVIAVGTTVVRALETAASPPSVPPGKGEKGGAVGVESECEGATCGWRTVSAYTGPTDLFIYPGYRFRVVEAMITNFHLPRSTLLMLVSAFAGRDLILRAYHEAVAREYRFFSFGDAMLLL